MDVGRQTRRAPRRLAIGGASSSQLALGAGLMGDSDGGCGDGPLTIDDDMPLLALLGPRGSSPRESSREAASAQPVAMLGMMGDTDDEAPPEAPAAPAPLPPEPAPSVAVPVVVGASVVDGGIAFFLPETLFGQQVTLRKAYKRGVRSVPAQLKVTCCNPAHHGCLKTRSSTVDQPTFLSSCSWLFAFACDGRLFSQWARNKSKSICSNDFVLILFFSSSGHD